MFYRNSVDTHGRYHEQMNLEARTWLVDVQATTDLEYFDPVFPILNFASTRDIHFCF